MKKTHRKGYYICQFCEIPIKAHKYDKHMKKLHGGRKTKTIEIQELRQILEEAKVVYEREREDIFSIFRLYFEIARKAFSKIEKINTSSWSYFFDDQFPEFISRAKTRVPTEFPPMMAHIKGKVKDEEVFKKLLEKYKGTGFDDFLKQMVSGGHPVVFVYKKNWVEQVRKWKAEGLTSSDIMILAVYFFLHEMYHILGFGERESTIKAVKVMSRVFNRRILIPEHEIKRWELEKILKN